MPDARQKLRCISALASPRQRETLVRRGSSRGEIVGRSRGSIRDPSFETGAPLRPVTTCDSGWRALAPTQAIRHGSVQTYMEQVGACSSITAHADLPSPAWKVGMDHFDRYSRGRIPNFQARFGRCQGLASNSILPAAKSLSKARSNMARSLKSICPTSFELAACFPIHADRWSCDQEGQ